MRRKACRRLSFRASVLCSRNQFVQLVHLHPTRVFMYGNPVFTSGMLKVLYAQPTIHEDGTCAALPRSNVSYNMHVAWNTFLFPAHAPEVHLYTPEVVPSLSTSTYYPFIRVMDGT